MQCETRKRLLSYVLAFLALSFALAACTMSVSAETSYDDYSDLGSAADEYENVEKPDTDQSKLTDFVDMGKVIVENSELMAPVTRVLTEFVNFCNIETYAFFTNSKAMTDIETFALLGGLAIVGALVLHGKSATE